MFSNSTFYSALEKSNIYDDFQKFVSSGFKSKHFTKRLYSYLSLNFGFIAHFNCEGFCQVRFDSAENLLQTFAQIVRRQAGSIPKHDPSGTNDLNVAVARFTVKSKTVFVSRASSLMDEELKELAISLAKRRETFLKTVETI